MATSQDLVPTGGDYGVRQETVALMQQAGLPTGSSPNLGPRSLPTPPPLSPGAAGQPLAGTALLSATRPEDFPFLNDPQQVPPSSEPDSPLAALAQTAQSSFGLAVLARLNAARR